MHPPKSKYVREEERESSVVVEPPDVYEAGVGLVGEHLDARHVLRRDEVAVVPAEHGYLHCRFGINVNTKYLENPRYRHSWVKVIATSIYVMHASCC